MDSDRENIFKIVKIPLSDLVIEASQGKDVRVEVRKKIQELGIDLNKTYESYFDPKTKEYIFVQ